MKRFAPILIVVLAAGGCVRHVGDVGSGGPAAQAGRYDYRVVRDVVYSPAGWPETLRADIYRPVSKTGRPAVLVVHGGGWEAGRTRRDMRSIADHLATRGYVAVNISYRFAPDYRFPAQLHDLQQAMHWIHEHAAEYGIDADRIGGFGYSAGAHLVTLLGVVSAGDALDRPHGGAETRLDAVVAGGIPADLREFDSGRLVRQFLGGVREEIPALYERASPVVHVTADDPPTFLYHGGWDQLVPPAQSRDMFRALQAAGVASELYINKSRGHITMFVFDEGAIEAGIDFLDRHLAAPDD